MLIRQMIRKIRSLIQRFKRRFRTNPQGFFPSVQAWVASQPQPRSPASYTEIYPSVPVHRPSPQTIDAEIYWKFRQDYGQPAAAFVATVPQGRVCQDGAVITANHKLLSDVSVVVRVDPQNPIAHPVFHRPLPPLKKIRGTVAVLSTMGGNTYFHWLIDLLPRLHLLRQSQHWQEIDYFYVNGIHQSFQRETLQMLNIPLDKVISGKDSPHLQADRLIVASHPRQGTCAIGSWVFEFLRESLLPQVVSSAQLQSLPRRIYVSRNQASRRKVTNESAVFEYLQEQGFERIFLENLSVAEQIQHFAAAEYVIAPHGAGLTNLVFCSPQTKVIEIYSPNYVSVSYWNISAQMGLDYHYLFGAGERPIANVDPHALQEDILVEIPALQQAMAAAGMIERVQA
jgi:Glycosyltransferase 61